MQNKVYPNVKQDKLEEKTDVSEKLPDNLQRLTLDFVKLNEFNQVITEPSSSRTDRFGNIIKSENKSGKKRYRISWAKNLEDIVVVENWKQYNTSFKPIKNQCCQIF